MSNIADLVIVGAGPAGSNAAKVALEAGLTVVQVDKAIFPRLKPCAGGLTGKSLRSLQFYIEPMLRFQSSVIECNIWGDEVNRFRHRKILISMVVRPEFDNYLVEQNRRSSDFTFHDGQQVKSISYDGQVFEIATPQLAIKGRQLLGADGANGIVNRTFRISNPRFAYALEVNPLRSDAEMRTEIQTCIDLCVIKQGYGWVFPKDNQWSVGLYTLAKGIPQLKLLLVEYMKTKGIMVRGDPLATFEAHPIPIGGYRLNVPEIPVYIAGDAGGFADAILGEGIYYALESGRLAGIAAVSVAQGMGSHRAYYKSLRHSILPDTLLTYWFARLFIYGEYRGLGWRIGKRMLQRLLTQAYAESGTFTEALLRAGLYFPRSFRDTKFEVERSDT
ncbi:MAG: geranylgeranyl reductase family protein [bacterium]|nr:geranylgeranyl reductase family protein [bacterium]